MKRFTLLGILTIALALPAAAERILYIDAAQPGGDPSNTWLDLSASGYDFANDLSSPATYNAADLSYDFEFSDSMTGMGDETLFDFERYRRPETYGPITAQKGATPPTSPEVSHG